MAGRNSLFQQLLTVDFNKIHVGARSSLGRRGRLLGRGRFARGNRESGLELGGNFVAHLEAAARDARPDSRLDNRRVGPKALPHRLNGTGRDALLRAAPSRVDGGDGPPAAIDQQQRQAIGRANRKQITRHVSDQGIGLGPLRAILRVVHPGQARPDQQDPVGVDLPDRPKPHALGPEPLEGLGIRRSVSEITGPPRRKTMQQPG
jgi:hypothetical protein